MSDANRLSRSDTARLWQQLTRLRHQLMAGLQGGLPTLAALDLTVPQSMVLFRLVEGGPLSISELQTVSGRSQAATSHLVTELARRGLAVRRHDPADARRTLVAPTPRASRVVQQVEGLRLKSFQNALAPVPASVIRTFDAALASLLAAMEHAK